ncbi:protein-S-isoprenylcysteine O-methyltransferase [Xylophilus sp. ASV27]|uniref:protein-S-isoprenylcysteine O-methyltransferase n=1 Tax=Xylophilus sp. ASV27 TaxID=2795129 RepID=UPI0018EC4D26|nr:protein-S-isoprenylcysteine O-methyltransferase [Xylophilus sp. ASV27]
MNLQIPHLVFAAGIATYLTIRAVFSRRLRARPKAVDRSDTGDRMLVGLVAIGQIVLPLLLLFSPWLDWARYTLPAAAAWLGAAVMAAGVRLFWRAHVDLGESWSVTLMLNPEHKLVTRGVYRAVRHPMYAAFFVLAIGQVLLLDNWFAGWASLVAVTVLYWRRVPHEERMMLEFFGDEYRAYMRRTGGILPRLGARNPV